MQLGWFSVQPPQLREQKAPWSWRFAQLDEFECLFKNVLLHGLGDTAKHRPRLSRSCSFHYAMERRRMDVGGREYVWRSTDKALIGLYSTAKMPEHRLYYNPFTTQS